MSNDEILIYVLFSWM